MEHVFLTFSLGKQDQPVIHELPISLEDINKGCTKKMKITKYYLDFEKIPQPVQNMHCMTCDMIIFITKFLDRIIGNYGSNKPQRRKMFESLH